MEILQKTLQQMNSSFSSNEFYDSARKNGITREQIKSGSLHMFLYSTCTKQGRRMWSKLNNSDNNADEKIQFAIDLLKSNGYKVMKQVSDWREI